MWIDGELVIHDEAGTSRLGKTHWDFLGHCNSRCVRRHQTLAGCSKWPSSEATASEEARLTLGYVESRSDARTKLADFFSILLERHARLSLDAKHGFLPEARFVRLDNLLNCLAWGGFIRMNKAQDIRGLANNLA